MTNEDKKLIADYMGWCLSAYDGGYYYIPKNGRVIRFDSNDASLCVQEMQKRGDWRNFLIIARNLHKLEFDSQVIAWLFNPENFFNAMAQWLKEGK